MRAARGIGAGLLLLGGFGCIGAGVVTESHRSLAATPRHGSESTTPLAVTPVLSARRVPDLLVRPQAARRLSTKLTPLLAVAPAQTCLVVADGGATVFAAKPDDPMPAASNQKLITALTALGALGPDATFTTRLASQHPVTNGAIDGDLWMIGGGDPIIDTDTYQLTLHYGQTPHTRLEDIADKIVAAGVHSIRGAVRGDDTLYDSLRTVPTWPARYLKQNQVGPLSALTVNDSRTYQVIPGAKGPAAQPAADPPAYAATALTQLLQARGVAIGALPSSGTAPAGLQPVLDVPSLPLKDIVKEMLTFSDNNTAELLLKAVGLHTAKEGSTKAGLAAALATLAQDHFDTNGVVLVDGSGLDDANRVTCRLLESVLGRDGPHGDIANGLAVADGPDGTLRDRFKNSPAARAVRAKTGTLKAVTALSGWVATSKHVDVRFSLVINTGGRDVSAGDLTIETRVAEAIMSYPDAVDASLVAPRSAPGDR